LKTYLKENKLLHFGSLENVEIRINFGGERGKQGETLKLPRQYLIVIFVKRFTGRRGTWKCRS